MDILSQAMVINTLILMPEADKMNKIKTAFNQFWNKYISKENQEKANSMNLQNFVTESLLQIIDGIKDAQNKISAIEIPEDDKKYFTPYIAPTPLNIDKKIYENYDKIEFDIAITVSKDSTQSGKMRISVAGLEIDGRSQSLVNSHSSISRIKFSIPVIYPSMPKPHGC